MDTSRAQPYIYSGQSVNAHILIFGHAYDESPTFAILGMCQITLCLQYVMSGGAGGHWWLTHTNVFLIFPVGGFGGKNYINAWVDAPRRDTSIAVVGIANRARIKKLIFRILVIKSMKTAFTRASSEI